MRSNRLRIGRIFLSFFAALFVAAVSPTEAAAASDPPHLKSLDAGHRAAPSKPDARARAHGKTVAHVAKPGAHGKGEADPKGRAKEGAPATKGGPKTGAAPRGAPKSASVKGDARARPGLAARGLGSHPRAEKEKEKEKEKDKASGGDRQGAPRAR
jgi:hypothetical protein